MILDSPNKALLWRCWRLSWKPMLVAQLCLLALLVPLLAIFVDPADSEAVNGLVNAFMFGYLLFLWAATLQVVSASRGSWNTGGYHFVLEMAQPVGTTQLILLPMAFLVALFTVAYLVPSLILQWLFTYDGPSWTAALIIIEVIVLITALIWWTSDALDSFLGWIAFTVLFLMGWLYPEFSQDNPVAGLSAGELILYLVVIGASLVITVLGVGKQRCGENLLGLSRLRWLDSRTGLFGKLTLPFFKIRCPTQSPTGAESWRLRRFRGTSNYLFYGVIAGLFPPLVLGSIYSFSPDPEPVPLVAVIGLSCGALWVLALASSQSFFGLVSTGQSIEFSLFNRVRPLPVATMTRLNAVVLLTGMIAAAASQFVTLQLIGPLLIPDFAGLNQQFAAMLGSWLDQTLIRNLSWLILIPAYVLCITVLLSAFIAWCTLEPRRTTMVCMIIPVYALGLVTVTGFGLSEGSGITVKDLLLNHLWIAPVLVATGIVYFLREIQKDRTLDRSALPGLLITALLLAGLFVWRIDLPLRIDEPGFPLLNRMLEYTLAFVPLFTALLALFTMNRVVHR